MVMKDRDPVLRPLFMPLERSARNARCDIVLDSR